jgi:hypothetical protein
MQRIGPFGDYGKKCIAFKIGWPMSPEMPRMRRTHVTQFPS